MKLPSFYLTSSMAMFCFMMLKFIVHLIILHCTLSFHPISIQNFFQNFEWLIHQIQKSELYRIVLAYFVWKCNQPSNYLQNSAVRCTVSFQTSNIHQCASWWVFFWHMNKVARNRIINKLRATVSAASLHLTVYNCNIWPTLWTQIGFCIVLHTTWTTYRNHYLYRKHNIHHTSPTNDQNNHREWTKRRRNGWSTRSLAHRL